LTHKIFSFLSPVCRSVQFTSHQTSRNQNQTWQKKPRAKFVAPPAAGIDRRQGFQLGDWDIKFNSMRRTLFMLFAVILWAGFSETQAASARPRKITEKSILQVVKKTPHLVTYYSKDERGRRILVVTNKDGRPSTSAAKSERTAVLRQKQIPSRGRQQNVNRQTSKRGIPYPKRNPHRVINPNRSVNPFRDPTAVPNTPSPDSE
jgi:hypothetical protein